MKDPTIDELMGLLEQNFVPQAAGNTHAVVQFHLSGEEGGDWVARIDQGTCKIEKGSILQPDLRLDASARDIIDLFLGKLNPMSAFFTGKLKVQGDQRLAFQLATFFRLPNRL